jgi:hypothetical protein
LLALECHGTKPYGCWAHLQGIREALSRTRTGDRLLTVEHSNIHPGFEYAQAREVGCSGQSTAAAMPRAAIPAAVGLPDVSEGAASPLALISLAAA